MTETKAASPLSGWLLPLDEVPDPVFAERMLGDGVAIDPTDGVVRAPFGGRLLTLHAAGHALTIESDAGAVLLIHVGLETVGLGGAGFTAHRAAGDRVRTGEPLITVDLDAVGQRAKSLVTPVVLTNGDHFRLAPVETGRLVAAGEPLLRFEPIGTAPGAAAVETAVRVERTLLVPLAHGLHARPAARVAALAREFASAVEIRGSDGRAASARSPVAMLALALRHGERVAVVAEGADADAAADAIVALIGSGMGEGAPLAAPAASQSPESGAAGPPPPLLTGVRASGGLAVGPAARLPEEVASGPRDGAGVAHERARLAAALGSVRTDLESAARRAGPAGAIADAHLAFLSDPELADAADRALGDGRAAGFAWSAAIERFVGLLRASGDRRFVERIDDLRDLERQVLAALDGGGARLEVPAGAILLADVLLPSQLMALADAGLAGIATAGGGPTSHVAIIAAGLGLPMVAALGPELGRVAEGTPLLLDGEHASLAIDPAPALVADRQRSEERARAFRAAAALRAHEPAITRDGLSIEVFANLASVAEAERAAAAGAEGCGLLRTEFLFLDRDTPPDAAEQEASYRAIACALGDRPLIVRTLDIGADKPARYVPVAAEENPALGMRGIRLALAEETLLASQLDALVRVGGGVRVMLPMVSEPAEVVRVRSLLEAAAREAGCAVPELGIMVETPAAALLARQLGAVADFFSVGSNDLTQYALAADRGNPAVAARLDPLHPAVLRLIAAAAEGARANGRWIGVCGGMAADPLAVPLLLGLGLTELSVPVGTLAETKARVRRVDVAAARSLADRALAQGDAAAVRALVAAEFGEDGE